MSEQLFRLSPPEFTSSLIEGDKGEDTPIVKAAVPWVSWPDGRWCIEVNLFLQHLFNKGYSIKGRGGTLATYTAYLTPLIHYCFTSQKTFIDLIDAEFTLLIRGLGKEKQLRKGELVQKRSAGYICKTGSVWLEFLSFIGIEYYADPHFVGKEMRIKGYKELVRRQGSDGKIYFSDGWVHLSFPEPEPDNRRLPVDDSQLTKLRAAAEQIKASDFVRRRRLVMLELFESLGFRRMEATLLRVSDVRNALRELKSALRRGDAAFVPMIRFRTVKGKDSKYGTRLVPIDTITLSFLESFGKARKRYLLELGIKDDLEEGLFLVNARTGEGLMPNTITQEFSLLASFAGIVEQCCPHMMRHRYITKAFVRLILAHHLEHEDDFRKLLLDDKVFKQKVREITGHASEESLNIYINLAFDQIAGLEKTMGRVQVQAHIDALKAANDRFKAAKARGVGVEEAARELSEAIDLAGAVASEYVTPT